MAESTLPDTLPDVDEVSDEEPEVHPLDGLIAQAEALLHPSAAGYTSTEEYFDNGVRAVLDLLRAAK